MSAEGQAVGIDAIPELSEQARAGGGDEVRVMTYEALAEDELDARFDAVSAISRCWEGNSVERLFQAVPSLLNWGLAFIVRTRRCTGFASSFAPGVGRSVSGHIVH